MPPRIPKPCTYPGCGILTVKGGRCAIHIKQTRQRQDKERGTAHARGYGARWQRARLLFLDDHPLCKRCEDKGLVVPANVVDHIQPHKGDGVLFWDQRNWQPLCKPCHDKKTATEDGGFMI